ncbi:UNVERIFIED_CONTAM: hypothetical protein NY100_02780 [Prevotella sp. 15_C9]
MVKKKTSVVLPGGIANLVHQVQGAETPATPGKKEETPKPAEPVRPATSEEPSPTPESTMQPTPGGKDRSAPAAKKLPKAEGKELAREYTLAIDNSEESWQLFLDLAKEYKRRDTKLATVYIDSDLKSVLDRLKSASSVKLPSTAILSSIVARFIFDHEKDIKNAIFGESLL